ncbi:PRD domain-containing protein [Clostridium sp.]|uniref:PRD domain-containing protein n=1 Tax=Clostridium sp. TaxID=1506 RepID=UPI00261A003C|nr:PRD domain-containing protein [Clostridium sp.]
MELTLRLGILRDADQLSEENYDKIMEIIEYFEREKGVKLLEENAAMFITHLCAALKRIDEDNLVNEMDEEIRLVLQCEDKYKDAIKIIEDLEKILGSIPKSEIDFLVMHVCSLV